MEGLALAQGIDKVFQLVDKELRGPELRALVGKQSGVAASKLIVVDDRAAAEAQQLVGIDIVVGGARPTMQDEDRWFAVSSSRL